MDIVKGHLSFTAFLDTELPALGLTHWYVSGDNYSLVGGSHYIGREKPLLFFWKRCKTLAEITAEPDSPISGRRQDKFRIKIIERESLPQMKRLAERFETAGFNIGAEVVE